MKEELSIDIIGLAGAYSYALDCIEAELVNIKNKHGKRVAYISICMAEYWEIQGDELQDLAMWEWAPVLPSRSTAARDTSYEICNKPVQEVIKDYYGRDKRK